jgi:hypothetical protein
MPIAAAMQQIMRHHNHVLARECWDYWTAVVPLSAMPLRSDANTQKQSRLPVAGVKVIEQCNGDVSTRAQLRAKAHGFRMANVPM